MKWLAPLVLLTACGRVSFEPLDDGGGPGGGGDGPRGDGATTDTGSGSACSFTGTPSCPTAGASLNLAGTYNSSGHTSGEGSGLAGSCGGANAEEHTVQFVVMATATYTFTTRGSDYNTVLYLRASCGGAELACNDDFATDGHSAITIALTQGQNVIAVVDGANGLCGNYALAVGTSVTP